MVKAFGDGQQSMPIEALVQNSGRRNDDGGVGSVDDHFCKSPRQ